MVLISVSFGLFVPEAAALLMPATKVLLQLKVVPAVALVGVYENTVLLQIAAGVKVLVGGGIGFTTATTLYVAGLEQPLADKVYI